MSEYDQEFYIHIVSVAFNKVMKVLNTDLDLFQLHPEKWFSFILDAFMR